MICSDRRICSVALLVIAVVSASMTVLPGSVAADRETATIQPGTFVALYFEMDKGVGLEFTVTSNVAILVAVLDEDDYQSYSDGEAVSSPLLVTSAPVTSVSATVEAPEDGMYYIIMQNEDPAAASVTVDYELHAGNELLYTLIIGGVVGAVVGLIIAMVVKRRKSQSGGDVRP